MPAQAISLLSGSPRRCVREVLSRFLSFSSGLPAQQNILGPETIELDGDDDDDDDPNNLFRQPAGTSAAGDGDADDDFFEPAAAPRGGAASGSTGAKGGKGGKGGKKKEPLDELGQIIYDQLVELRMVRSLCRARGTRGCCGQRARPLALRHLVNSESGSALESPSQSQAQSNSRCGCQYSLRSLAPLPPPPPPPRPPAQTIANERGVSNADTIMWDNCLEVSVVFDST